MPEQERPQDQLAETGLLGHDHPHLRRREPQHPPGRGHHRTQVDALAGEQADLAQELRPAIRGDHRLARLAEALDDPDPASQHHEQVVGQIPVGEQHLSGAGVVLSPVSAQHLKLRRVPGRDCARPEPAAKGSRWAAPRRGRGGCP